MTGFGQAIVENEHHRVTADVKTVNNRFLDIHTKLPAEIFSEEMPIKRQIQAVLKRGRVDLTITLTQTLETSYEINLPLLRGYAKALKQIQMELDLDTNIDLSLLTKLPNAIQLTTSSNSNQDILLSVREAVDQALTKLKEMRINEGQALARELNKRLDLIQEAIPNIENNSNDLLPLYRERLQKRMQELLPNAMQFDEARFAQEVAYLAERSDITEEITRLKSHIVQFRELLSIGEEVGKKLDFLLQEMNREANTILSKSGELNISKIALDIKTEIEKLREQVQNVE